MAMQKNDEIERENAHRREHTAAHTAEYPASHGVPEGTPPEVLSPHAHPSKHGEPNGGQGQSRSQSPKEPSTDVNEAVGTGPALNPEAEESPRLPREKQQKNNVRKIRIERMMSKAELARRAGMSTLTIDRVERGLPCRMDTKRKILEALGLKPSDRMLVFGEDD